MMDMSKKQLEFFTILIWIAVVTAAIILVIDFQIKGSILEQTLGFRRQYEEYQRGQKGTSTASQRSDNHGNNNPAYPSDMVGSGSSVVEKASHNGSGNEAGSAGTARAAKRKTTGRPGSIPPESE
jgi:hypothetical protein